MNTWAQVDKLKDEEAVNAETLNRPVDQLASRTEYLKKRLGNIQDAQSALILRDITLVSIDNSSFSVGDIVYSVDDGFAKAQAKMHLYDDFKTADSAFTIGILISVNGSVGDVLIYGKMDIGSYSLMTKSSILQDGETFRSGRYYLSATEPGKLTANPSGPLIYVGSFHSEKNDSDYFSSDSVAYINPQFLDIGTSHVHRAYSLMARPAGDTDSSGNVIGYKPDSHESTSKGYPTIEFGGTWESKNDITYKFTLEGSDWGNIKLLWTKNGDTSKVFRRNIPAPGVFIDIDNGLKAKLRFPEATSSKAITSTLTEQERTWTRKFPYAGKGWVNHSVEAIASVIGESSYSNSSCDTEIPSIHAVISGRWPAYDNTIICAFPSTLKKKTISSSTKTVTINGKTYEFVEDGKSPSEGNIAVKSTGNVHTTLLNLANTLNDSVYTATVVIDDATIYVLDSTITSGTSVKTGDNFNVIGGTISVMIAYSANYELVGSVVIDQQTYKPIALGNLIFSLFATGATSTTNITCKVGTRLIATAYDYSPSAMYDYVMGIHQEVDYYFPPVPAQSAGLFVNGVEVESSALFPDNPTYSVGRKTIHWLDSSSDHRPWPNLVTSHDDVVTDSSNEKTLAFYFIVGFQCASGPVTSIIPAPKSPIKLYTYGTNDPAYTGDLMIDAALDFSVVDGGVKGYNVVKSGRGGELLAGAIVEKIKAGPGISVTQESGCPSGQGTVTIGLDDGSMRNSFTEIALENAKQEKLGLFPYISLLGTTGAIPSAFTAMMRVPSNLDKDKNYQLQLRLVMFGTSSYEDVKYKAAGLRLEYNVLPDYSDSSHLSMKTGLLIPDNPQYRNIAVKFGHIESSVKKYIAYDPFVATTDSTVTKSDDTCVAFSNLPIPSKSEFTTKIDSVCLKPGYFVAIRISRVSVTSSSEYEHYTAPIGFLSMEWTLEEA